MKAMPPTNLMSSLSESSLSSLSLSSDEELEDDSTLEETELLSDFLRALKTSNPHLHYAQNMLTRQDDH